jgi:hypothetical protein
LQAGETPDCERIGEFAFAVAWQMGNADARAMCVSATAKKQ